MTMLLPKFELYQPTTVEDVVSIVKEHGAENIDFLAGGSDLLCNYKWGLNAKPHVIALSRVSALNNLEAGKIGACATLSEIASSEVIAKNFPVLAYVAKKVASVLIQEQATIGGNVLLDNRCHFFNQSYFWRRSLGYCLKADGDRCHVIPKIKRDGQLVENSYECFATNSSDFAPVLITLGAEFEFAGSEGTRTIAAKDFYAHDGRDRFVKKGDEFLVSISLPESAKNYKAGYKKLRPRESWDFPVLGIAATIQFDDSDKLTHFSLAVNAVDTHPIVFDDYVADWIGKPLDDEAINKIAEHVKASVQPKLTVPMEPGYRKKMAAVFTRRLLTELVNS